MLAWKRVGGSIRDQSRLIKFIAHQFRKRGLSRTKNAIRQKIHQEKTRFQQRILIEHRGEFKYDSLLADIFLPIESSKRIRTARKGRRGRKDRFSLQDSGLSQSVLRESTPPSNATWTRDELAFLSKGFSLFKDTFQENSYKVYCQVNEYLRMKGFYRDPMAIQEKLAQINMISLAPGKVASQPPLQMNNPPLQEPVNIKREPEPEFFRPWIVKIEIE